MTQTTSKKAILSTTNDIVDQINDYILTLVPNIEKEYLSADSILNCIDTCNDAELQIYYILLNI